jgi:hypothetical protein
MLSLADEVQYSKLLPRYEAAVLGMMLSAYQLVVLEDAGLNQ